MSITLTGNRLSFSLKGQPVELEACHGYRLRASYGQRDGRPILRVLSFSAFTQDQGREHCWIYDGTGWTPDAESSTDENQGQQTLPPNAVRRSDLDGAFWVTCDGGKSWIKESSMSSTMTGSEFESYVEAGKQLAEHQASVRLRTILEEQERQSSCREGSTQRP